MDHRPMTGWIEVGYVSPDDLAFDVDDTPVGEVPSLGNLTFIGATNIADLSPEAARLFYGGDPEPRPVDGRLVRVEPIDGRPFLARITDITDDGVTLVPVRYEETPNV